MAHDTALGGWRPRRTHRRQHAGQREDDLGLHGVLERRERAAARLRSAGARSASRSPRSASSSRSSAPACWCGRSITTARWRRFGETWLDTSAGAARDRAALAATLHARLPQPDGAGRLRAWRSGSRACSAPSRRHSDERERARAHPLARGDRGRRRAAWRSAPTARRFRSRFDIPADALETTAVGKGEGILWVLTAEAALPGVNLKEDFDVPVHGGRGSSDPPSARGPGSSDPGIPAISLDDLARTGITVEPSPEGMTLHVRADAQRVVRRRRHGVHRVWTGRSGCSGISASRGSFRSSPGWSTCCWSRRARPVAGHAPSVIAGNGDAARAPHGARRRAHPDDRGRRDRRDRAAHRHADAGALRHAVLRQFARG